MLSTVTSGCKSQMLEFITVSDLDHFAMFCGGKDKIPSFAPNAIPRRNWNHSCMTTPLKDVWWLAFMRRGVLALSLPPVNRSAKATSRDAYPTFAVQWLNTTVLRTQSATRGRSMELSEVIRFRHNILAACDITGLVWKLRVADGSIFQRYAIADGNGEVPKPCKIEWATRKDGQLMLGSVGKSFLDVVTGNFINRDAEWIKVISPSGRIENSDWGPVYAALRRAAGVESAGYLWHEAIEWDALSRRWIIMPRKRALRTPFEPTMDELKGTNIILVADEGFRNIEVKMLGEVEEDWGVASVRRVPGQRNVFAAIKTREVDEAQQSVSDSLGGSHNLTPWLISPRSCSEAYFLPSGWVL